MWCMDYNEPDSYGADNRFIPKRQIRPQLQTHHTLMMFILHAGFPVLHTVKMENVHGAAHKLFWPKSTRNDDTCFQKMIKGTDIFSVEIPRKLSYVSLTITTDGKRKWRVAFDDVKPRQYGEQSRLHVTKHQSKLYACELWTDVELFQVLPRGIEENQQALNGGQWCR